MTTRLNKLAQKAVFVSLIKLRNMMDKFGRAAANRKDPALKHLVIRAMVPVLITLILSFAAHAGDFEKALAAHDKGDYRTAVNLFTQAIKAKNHSAFALARLVNRRGLAYKSLGKTDNALADFDKAIELDPSFADPYFNRARLSEGLGKDDQALKDFNQAIELRPGYAEAYFGRGALWAKQGMHDRAVADYTMAVQINPSLVQAFISRGNSHHALGKRHLALEDYDRAITVDPNYPQAYYHRAVALKAAGLLEPAERDAARYLKLSPNDPEAETLITEVRGLIKARKAREDNKSRQVSRPAADPFKAAVAAHRRGNFAEAVKLYTLDIDSDRNTDDDLAVVYNNRGNALADMGELDKALADYSKALELKTKYAMAYFNRAAAHEKKGNHDAAVADYDMAQRLDPRWASVYMARSFTYERMGRLDLAVNDLESHQSLRPGNKRGAERLKRLRALLAASRAASGPGSPTDAPAIVKAGLAAHQKGDYDQAIKFFTEALTAKRNSPATLAEAYFGRARSYVRKGQPDKAVSDYTRAAALTPRQAKPFLHRGNLWHAKGNYTKAVADYTKALQLDDDDWRVYNSRGNSLLQLGRITEAVADYTKALTLKPDEAQPLYNRAFAHWRGGQLDKAATDLAQFLKAVPDDRAGRQLQARLEAESLKRKTDPLKTNDPFGAGLLAYQRGDYPAAITYFTLVIKNPNSPRKRLVESFNNRGLCHRRMGDLKLALADYNRALNLMPNYDTAINNLGNIWLKRREYDQAIAEFTRAISINPKDAGYYFNRGLAWQQKGDPDQAISDYNRAVELKPDFARAYAFRGIAWARKNELQRALDDYNRSARIQPGLAMVRFYRAKLYLTMGRLADALADAKAFTSLSPDDEDGIKLLDSIRLKLAGSQ